MWKEFGIILTVNSAKASQHPKKKLQESQCCRIKVVKKNTTNVHVSCFCIIALASKITSAYTSPFIYLSMQNLWLYYILIILIIEEILLGHLRNWRLFLCFFQRD